MRYIAPLLFLLIVIVGCDPVKNLDWDRTAKSQRLRVGNQVKFIGITYGLPMYKFKKTDNATTLWFKKNWDTELDLWTYNPDNPVNDVNPNAPIGTVIGTIYNPMHNQTLKALRNTYPNTTTIFEFPNRKHKFEVIGRIHSFKRATKTSADDTMPDISLTAVRIHVESLTHIESINLKE